MILVYWQIMSGCCNDVLRPSRKQVSRLPARHCPQNDIALLELIQIARPVQINARIVSCQNTEIMSLQVLSKLRMLLFCDATSMGAHRGARGALAPPSPGI